MALTRAESQGVVAHLDHHCFGEEEVLAKLGLFVPGWTGVSLQPASLPSYWAVYSSLGLKSVYFERRECLGFITGETIGSSSTMDGTEGFLSRSR